ncbi:unnamed protein product, partial [Candidula unifasciata]
RPTSETITTMDSLSDRLHDPLLFLNTDKSDLDAFLMSTSADMANMSEDMHVNVSDIKMDNSLDLDGLESGGHLGDMSWLHNSSLSTLAHLDSDDTSDGSNLISVNPQSVYPIHVVQNLRTQHFLSSENANSAAIRLHTNCGNHLNSSESASHSTQQQVQVSTPQAVLSQDHQTIRIMSVQSKPLNSPAKAHNFLITSSRDSSHKAPQTFLLSTVDGSFPAGLTISSADLPVHFTSAGSHIVLSSPQKLPVAKTDTSSEVLAKSGHSLISPSQASPVLLGRLQTGVQPQVYQKVGIKPTVASSTVQLQQSELTTVSSTTNNEEKVYPKPVFSYSCLIALALKNSKNGSLPVSEIYSFMCENFPYFKTAPDGWKNSVRHNLSLNKCFAKVDNPKLTQGAKKGCLWALNPTKVTKMDDEISKWSKKDPVGLLTSMAYPENLEAIEKGQAGLHYSKKKSPDSTPCTPIKTEPFKTEFTLDQKPEFSQIRLEKHNSNIPFEKVELKHPVKVEPLELEYSLNQRGNSPVIKQELPSPSPKDYAIFKIEPSDYSCSDIPVSFSNDALTDIVLQNSVWDDDLENNIDIDLICDSSSSHLPSPTTSSPVMFRSSPNPSLPRSL